VTKTTTRNFFFGGTILFALVFIGLTVQTHTTISRRTHADKLTESVKRGQKVWGRYNCENCHTLLGEGAYYAPDLTQIVAQRGSAYLTQFLADPSRFYSEARDGRLMPTLGLAEREIEDVIAFLDWVGNIDTNGWPPRPILVSGIATRAMPGVSGAEKSDDPVSRGRALFNGIAACASCHSIDPGVRLVGPSLSGVATRAAQRIEDPAYTGQARTAEAYLEESILTPSVFIAPGENFSTPRGLSLMPATIAKSLTPEQIEDLIAYLMSLR
jgi:nitric oxide reductase subunit C